MLKQTSFKSFCSQPLMYFVNEYSAGCPDDIGDTLNDFLVDCVSFPLRELCSKAESPTFAHEVQKMIDTYNWYITNRFWAFQLLYPVVSFLQTYYSIILHSSDVGLYQKMLQAYVESLSGDVI